MGKKENPLLSYYNQEERFTQLMNGWLFRGKPYFKAEDVSEADRRLEGKSGKGIEQGIQQGIQQGIDQAKKAFRLSGEGLSIEEIARRLAISEDKVRRILE